MIAKEIAMPRTGGSFRGLITYLTSAHAKTERVGLIQLTNCVSGDVESAILEVRNAQARNRRARHTTYHLMLAFPHGEHPSSAVLEAIERRACVVLGFENHQRVSVVHHDTDHLHLHIAINRVSPLTHKVHSPSYSKLVLDRFCVEAERDFGLRPTPHFARGGETRPRERRVPDMERVAGVESLVGFVQRRCAASLRTARSWAEVHEIAGAHGLAVRLRGNGLVFVTTQGLAVKASSVSRDLSKAATERRLGPFEIGDATSEITQSGYQKQPLSEHRSALLYERYLQERAALRDQRSRAITEVESQRERDQERLRRASERRWASIRVVAKGRLGWKLWIAYARNADRRDRERARQRHRDALRAAAVKYPRTNLLDWARNHTKAPPIGGEPLERRALLSQNKEHVDAAPRPRRSPTGVDGTIPTDATGPGFLARPTRTRLRKPYDPQSRLKAPPQPVAHLPNVSALPVVRFGSPPQVLLPLDARRDVDERSAGPDPVVRRDPDRGRVKQKVHRKHRQR